MLYSSLRYGAIRSPLGCKPRHTRLFLRFKTPKTITLALSTAPATRGPIRNESTFKPHPNEALLGERPDQLEEDALLFEQDDARIQGELEPLRQSGGLFDESEDDGLSGHSPIHPTAENGLSDHDSIAEAKQAVMDALYDGDHEKLLHAFQRASMDETYVGSIPATMFMEILRTLDPMALVDPYKEVYRDLHPSDVKQLGAEQFQDVFYRFVSIMEDIIRKRRAAGFKMGIGEYKCILNCIRSGGDATAARAVWNGMLEDGVEPDTLCYNYYFETLCWSNAYDPMEREKLRVIPYHMSMRLPVKLGRERRPGFMGYQVGDRGICQEVVKLFSNMVDKGIAADEKTFCLLMTAMAREGDLLGPKSVLRKVWDVDVDTLLSRDDSAVQSAEILPTTSPVYPSEWLLFTIAHIFGSNNDIPTALCVVDHVSRKYSLEITREVWAQLLEWTFVLASRRNGNRKSDGAQLGQLPLQSVENLWNTMVSEPYNVQPTTPMYNRLIRNLWSRDMIDLMLSNMRMGLQGWLSKRAQLGSHLGLLQQDEGRKGNTTKFPTSIEAMSKEVRLLRLQEARDYAMIQRWVRLLFAGRRWNWDGDTKRLAWALRGLPAAMDEWSRFKPRKGFAYNMYAGRLRFNPRDDLRMPVRWIESTSPGITIVQHSADGFRE
ncbi:MAG: hypothetical protein FRX48_07567 [Lasallia pustulata]|uniref:Pentatricopeptide repeat n=1 Tax=Lasallia pustulata TaxID=136370 RepID=A0A1W5CZU3_9LECA|nr:MAG: hypothetical protein FRX48_07567 [Lasallia pustulata]SLM36403.1 Pentatricopeptide repeat [Lasallia pustulata]